MSQVKLKGVQISLRIKICFSAILGKKNICIKNVLLFLGANSSAANISLDSSVLNIDNTTIDEEDTDTESVLG